MITIAFYIKSCHNIVMKHVFLKDFSMERKVLLALPVFAFLSFSVNPAIAHDDDTAHAIKVSAQAESKAAEENEMASKNSDNYSGSSCSIVSSTGFYAGADVGVDSSKGRFTKTTNSATENKKASGNSATGDIFGGYNFQMGRFIFGLECLVSINSAKVSTDISSGGTTDSVSEKRKYGLWIAPKVGYAISGGLSGYLNFGTAINKYALTSTDSSGKQTKGSPSKTSMFVGFGIEQSFGSIFVRGECNKIFKKSAGKVGDTSISADSYVFKIGGGYRF